MRVVFLQDHLRNGGTENQTLHLADELALAGIDTHLIVFRKGGILDAKAKASPVKLHFLRQGPLKTDWFAPSLKRRLKKLAPDLVIPMGRMANCHAGRLATTPRDYKLLSTFRTGKPIPELYQKALQHADHIVANSQEALDRLNTHYSIHRPQNSSVIYNGCIRTFTPHNLPSPTSSSSSSSASKASIPTSTELSRSSESKGQFLNSQFSTELRDTSTQRSKNNIHNSDRRSTNLLSVCMFRPEKQQIRLIQICASLKTKTPWQLTLAGDGPELERCKQEAEKLGLADRIHFPGLLTDPSAYYHDAHIAIHTSDRESLPNFLVEAQMAGLPVVAYETGGVAETFIDRTSGYLIPHGDASAFAEKLSQLIDSDTLRLQMSQAARDHARMNFTPETQIQAYTTLIEKLCS